MKVSRMLVKSSRRPVLVARWDHDPGVFYVLGGGRRLAGMLPLHGPFNDGDPRFIPEDSELTDVEEKVMRKVYATLWYDGSSRAWVRIESEHSLILHTLGPFRDKTDAENATSDLAAKTGWEVNWCN